MQILNEVIDKKIMTPQECLIQTVLAPSAKNCLAFLFSPDPFPHLFSAGHLLALCISLTLIRCLSHIPLMEIAISFWKAYGFVINFNSCLLC